MAGRHRQRGSRDRPSRPLLVPHRGRAGAPAGRQVSANRHGHAAPRPHRRRRPGLVHRADRGRGRHVDARRTPTDASPRRPCSTGGGGRGWPASEAVRWSSQLQRHRVPADPGVPALQTVRPGRLWTRRGPTTTSAAPSSCRRSVRRRRPARRAGMDRVRGRRRVVHVPRGHAARGPQRHRHRPVALVEYGSPTTSTPPTRR